MIFVTPYLGKWLNDRKSYFKSEYDEIIYPELEHVPLKFAINKRNEWMIDHADFVFTYVVSYFGGAYNALAYAKKQSKPYINLYE